jgi:AraC-like DNA-binding protein
MEGWPTTRHRSALCQLLVLSLAGATVNRPVIDRGLFHRQKPTVRKALTVMATGFLHDGGCLTFKRESTGFQRWLPATLAKRPKTYQTIAVQLTAWQLVSSIGITYRKATEVIVGFQKHQNLGATRGAQMDTRIVHALKAMHGNFDQRLRVSRLAEQAGLSRSRFEHIFREQTGLSFKAMLQEFRLTVAERLLGDRRLSVKEVASLVGYSSSPTFSREFRKRFGIAPSPYRRSTYG